MEPSCYSTSRSNLAKMLASLHPLFGLTGVPQRIDPIDRHGQLAGEDEFHDIHKLPLAAHGRADDADLTPKNDIDRGRASIAGGAANGQQPAAARQRAQTGLPGRRADIVHDHVHPSLAAAQENRLRPIRHGLAVYHPIRAFGECLLGLVCAAGDDPNGRAQQLGKLDGKAVDAAARTDDKHGLARPHLATRDEHAPGRHRNGRRGRGLLHRKAVGHSDHIAGGHLDELRKGAADVLAQERKLVTQALLTALTVSTLAAP